MQWYLRCVTVLLLSETLDSRVNVDDDAHTRTRRAIANNFDILLNIYKLNPLKESNVFKTFSNSILLPRPDGRTPVLNFDSNESTKEKRIRMRAKFKQIEDAIHVTNLDKSIVKRPSLNIQNTVERDIKTPGENDDFVILKHENPSRLEYGTVSLNLRDNFDQRVKSVQNMHNTGDLQANDSHEFSFYSNNDRATKNNKKKDEVEVFVMR